MDNVRAHAELNGRRDLREDVSAIVTKLEGRLRREAFRDFDRGLVFMSCLHPRSQRHMVGLLEIGLIKPDEPPIILTAPVFTGKATAESGKVTVTTTTALGNGGPTDLSSVLRLWTIVHDEVTRLGFRMPRVDETSH